MTKKLSRREFIKLAGVGTAATVLTGCGPASRYVQREPYAQMPEYNDNGRSTYYATTCRECPAACGLVVRTMQGRAIKVEGNQRNPVNLGKTCARGQATLQGLYNPDRIRNPLKQAKRGTGNFSDLDWETAIQVVGAALKDTQPSEIAFLLGLAPDHLFDLVSSLTAAIGAPVPLRFGALGMFESRVTLTQATEDLFGKPGLPFFDIGRADLVFSFGANFLETWLSPVAYTRGYSQMRKGLTTRRRGTLIQFEARMSQTGATADEWIPVRPGSEGLVALALGRLAAEISGAPLPKVFSGVDVAAASAESGIPEETLHRLAKLYADATNPVAIPGGMALAQSNGLQTAKAILALNALAGNLGQPGGLFFSPTVPLFADGHPASLAEMTEFVKKLESGQVKALFVHGVNPLFELPKSLGFENALKSVPLVISFATFPDETAMQADYILPDHHGLESWGYQRALTGSAQPVLSGAQPVVAPYYNTRATVDVLLAAAAQAGGKLAEALPFKDEVAYLQSRLLPLVTMPDGPYTAAEINSFMAFFQQHGGWWQAGDALTTPAGNPLDRTIKAEVAETYGEGEFFLLPFVSPILGEAGANKPWLQEVPDPTTTVMWNSWLEIHPKVAEELGLQDDDIVRLVSEVGSVELPVYRYPAIRPDTIAIPFGQGHTAYGRYAQGRGVNPLDLVHPTLNEAGDLTFAGIKVRLEKTGRKQTLARLESRMGVYGEEEH